MPPTTIHASPALDIFTTLTEHQSQTPATFYNAKPVLHYHSANVRALTSQDQISKLPLFSEQPNGQPTSADGERPMVAELVEVFVSSDNLTLFNPTNNTGLSIPYPTITLHAIQRLSDPSNPESQVQGLYMQLELSDPYGASEDDEEPEAIELTLIPTSNAEGTSDIQALFAGVSNCSNLHPDPMDEDEDMDDAGLDSRIVFEGSVGYEGISGLPGVQRGASNGGLPPPFPGSGGWITAENVSEYFDADGNWIGGAEGEEIEILGEGAGRVRTREERDGEEGLNGHREDDSEDNKRTRTD